MTAYGLSVVSLVSGIGTLATLGAWLITRRRYAALRIAAGVFVIIAAVSGYISRQPEKPVVGQGSLVGGRQGAGNPAIDRCAQARAFAATIPPECSP